MENQINNETKAHQPDGSRPNRFSYIYSGKFKDRNEDLKTVINKKD
jgi:hypothetical protein